MKNGKKFIAIATLLVLLNMSVVHYLQSIAIAADAVQSVVKIDEQRLAGRWVRPDGGYILELKGIGKDGKLKAAYFNPQPIKVFKAEWNRQQGIISVFVELRDVNYPGSKYNLRYDPKIDKLKGTYFQAVYGDIYDVEFVRAK